MNRFLLTIFLLSSALAQINIDKLIEIPAEKSESLEVQSFNQNQSSGSFSGVSITTGDATPSYNSVDLTSSIIITQGGSGEVGIYYNLVDSDGNSNWYVANLSIFLGNINIASDNAVTISGLKDTTKYSWKAAIAYKSSGVILALGETKEFSTIPYVPGQLKVPSQYSTIQAGLNAARTSDTVLVAAGTYNENIMWPDVNGIKLISAGDSSNTIIDGGGTSSVIYMNPLSATIDTTTLIQGFKITNGGGVSNGGGLYIGNDVVINVKNSIFLENTSTERGGGIFIINDSQSGLYMTDCKVVNNTTQHSGGGIALDYNGSESPFFHISGTKFISNNGQGESCQGAGIGATRLGTSSISNCYFENNINSGQSNGGGAIYFYSGELTVNNSTFKNNTAPDGGAIKADGGMLIVNNSEFIYNTANSNNGGAISSGSSQIENSKFIGNTAYSSGGAIKATGGIISGNIFVNNIVTRTIQDNNSGGGAIWIAVAPSSSLNIEDCEFVNNQAYSDIGDDIYFYTLYNTSSVSIINSSFIGSSSPNENSIYFWFNNGNSMDISKSNFILNENSIYNYDNSAIVNATNNYWGHSSGPYHPSQNPTGQGDSTNQWVNVDPWLTAPNTDAPPIPAQNLKLDSQTVTSATFSWDASKIGDLAGYKFYYDTDSSGYPYANSIDLGNVVTKSLTGLTAGKTYYVGVTTYDTDGNESWYSKEVAVQLNNPPVISSINDVTINEDESTTVELKATDPEGDPISFILKKNNVEGDFINFDGASGAKTWIQTKNEMNEEDHPIPDEGDFTVSVWARANTDANELMEIYSQGKQPGNIYLGSSGNLGETKYIRAGDSWGNTGVSFPVDGMWHHYVITKSSSDAYLYLDGALAASKGAPIDNPNPEGSGLYIGKQYGEGREYFDGNIAELTVWGSELSAAEIKTIYNSGLFLSPMRDTLDYKSSDNVTIYYDLSEGQDSTVYGKESNSSELFYGKINGTVEWREFRNPKIATSISGTALTLNPDKDWNGEANYLVIASDGNTITSASSSAAFKLTVTPVQDTPKPFFWNTAKSDSINITKDNLSSTYNLDWTESVDVDGDTINYIVYAKIGEYRSEEIFDTTATNYFIPYREIAEGAFEGLPGNAATVYFSVWAHDGTDSVKISRDDRVLYVNRYDYLSIESEGIPDEFALHENYPNPFNPTTQIRFDLPEMSNATLTIYNMIGQKIRTFNMQSAPAGYHSLTWNATNDLGAPVSAGVYLYQLQTEGFVKTKKMILLK